MVKYIECQVNIASLGVNTAAAYNLDNESRSNWAVFCAFFLSYLRKLPQVHVHDSHCSSYWQQFVRNEFLPCQGVYILTEQRFWFHL